MVYKKLLSLLLCMALSLGLCGTVLAQESLVTLQYYSEYSMTQNIGPVTGWVGDLYAQYGIVLEVLSSSVEKTQALLASGDLPDLMKFKDRDSFLIAVDAGMVVNLDEHMDKLPNVENNLGAVLDYHRKYMSSGTGSLYGTPDQVGAWYNPVDNDVYGIKFRWD